MVESTASLQLLGPQLEHGNLGLADAMQSSTLVACGGKLHKAHTPYQTHVQELAMGIGKQGTKQGIPHNALPGVIKER